MQYEVKRLAVNDQTAIPKKSVYDARSQRRLTRAVARAQSHWFDKPHALLIYLVALPAPSNPLVYVPSSTETKTTVPGVYRYTSTCMFRTLNMKPQCLTPTPPVILGDRWWPQRAKQEGDTTNKKSLRNIWKKKKLMSAQMLEVSLLGAGTVLRLGRGDAWSMVKRLRQAKN